MRTYVDASAAFAECLTRQVKLGTRIVAAAETLLRDQSAAEMRQCALSLILLHKEARLGKAELTKLRGAVRRAKGR
jgi:hypothetical protein